MNKTIYQTIALALCDYKTYWNKKINSYDKKYGSISIEAKDEWAKITGQDKKDTWNPKSQTVWGWEVVEVK